VNTFLAGLARYFSPGEIARIRATRVGIAGAGGLGSNCASLLARSGFCDFTIADHDVVDVSNLNRQFFFLHQVGAPKVEALRHNLAAINPDVAVRALQIMVTPDNVRELFADCHVVVEAFDSADAKRMLVEAYLGSGRFLVAASGLGGCGGSDRIKVHRMRDAFSMVGDLTTGVTPSCPPLAPCVMIAAAKQADLVLEHVIGSKP
jgi:sulfur carrier protein ThiS adenylyltransferase